MFLQHSNNPVIKIGSKKPDNTNMILNVRRFTI